MPEKHLLLLYWGFPGGSDSKSVCLQYRRPGFDPWVGKIPWRRKWQPTPVFLPGEAHGQRSLVGYSPQGRKDSDTTEPLNFNFPGGASGKRTRLPMQETHVRFLGRKDPLEKEMAIHSRILACKIQWTEEPGRLQSMGS